MNDPLAYLLANLRERDRQELAEYGYSTGVIEGAMRSPHIEFVMHAHDGKPACAIWFDAITPKTLVASMLATDDWPHVARHVYRWAIRACRPALLSLGFERAECRTMEGHAEAIRLLEHLGFELECRVPRFGASGKAFLQYAWTINRHRAGYLNQKLATYRAGRIDNVHVPETA
jgi:hypothetical protein